MGILNASSFGSVTCLKMEFCSSSGIVFRARFGLLSVLTGFDSLFVRCALITELRSAGMELLLIDRDDSSILLCMATVLHRTRVRASPPNFDANFRVASPSLDHHHTHHPQIISLPTRPT